MISGITDPASAAPQMDAAPGPAADPLGLVPSNSGPGLIAQADALPEAQAFRAEALATDGQTVLVRISAPSDYYLYRDQFKFVLRSDGATATPMFPASQLIKDEHFGDVEVYFGGVDIPLKLTRTSGAPANATAEATQARALVAKMAQAAQQRVALANSVSSAMFAKGDAIESVMATR